MASSHESAFGAELCRRASEPHYCAPHAGRFNGLDRAPCTIPPRPPRSYDRKRPAGVFRSRPPAGLHTPDVAAHLGALRLPPTGMGDLAELGTLRKCSTSWMRSASACASPVTRICNASFEASRQASTLSDARVLQALYESPHRVFRRASVRHRARTLLGQELRRLGRSSGPPRGHRKQARGAGVWGANAAHRRGHAPVIGATTILNNAIVRGDAIIKSPANDPDDRRCRGADDDRNGARSSAHPAHPSRY